jgi:two-component system NtrC family sensor kinase
LPLRSKLLAILFSVFFLYAGLYYGIQRYLVYPYFLRLEQSESKSDLARCVSAIEMEVRHLSTFIYDWSAWDDTYQFVVDRNPGFIKSNLTRETFTNCKIDLLYICDSDGKVIYRSIREPKGDAGEKLQLEGFPKDAFPPMHPLLRHTGVESSIAGVMLTGRGPMLIASRPIATSQKGGPIRGTLIMGRFLGDELVAALREQTGIRFSIWPMAESALAPEDKAASRLLAAGTPVVIREHDKRLLRGYTRLTDVEGSPAILIRADLPRIISSNVRFVMRFSGLSILAVGLLALLVMQSSLRRMVVEPITELTSHAIAVGQSSDMSSRLTVRRNDEIGLLTREFDRMLEQLAIARSRLLEQSYYSGKAEMAAGVLHNVRNSLNPIVVQIDALREDLRTVPLEHVQRARAELISPEVSPERARDLMQFLELANTNLGDLVRRTCARLENLSGQATQIERILLEHDGLQRAKPPVEQFRLDDLVRDAMSLMPEELPRFVRVEIDPSVEETGEVSGHRISLLQVFANLLMNASESIKGAGVSEGRVSIAAGIELLDGAEVVHARFRDNGEGIEPANLDRIFQRGFTTRGRGSGLGLHWSSNTVRAMNGRLWAESEGRGLGACFHVVIPRVPSGEKGGHAYERASA